jgi:hypothetical protein
MIAQLVPSLLVSRRDKRCFRLIWSGLTTNIGGRRGSLHFADFGRSCRAPSDRRSFHLRLIMDRLANCRKLVAIYDIGRMHVNIWRWWERILVRHDCCHRIKALRSITLGVA